ncbi:MAG: cryptochrome/photolyase family protein, partial [Pseudomonadota bacterium]
MNSRSGAEHLVLVLGDQLDRDNAALAAADPDSTRVLMVETAAEATHVPSHPQRIACFLAAMRHFAAELRERGWHVDYRTLDDGCDSIGAALADVLAGGGIRAVALTLPGEWRLLEDIRSACDDAGVELRIHDDTHFLSTPAEFRDWADGRRSLTMEYFYRDMRRRYGWLMDGDEPAGGQWNYDEDNRKSFGRDGPGELPATPDYGVDEITGAVLDAVGQRFADHPGRLEPFNWPVTRRQALYALRHFVAEGLPLFGRYQDAMWQGEPLLYHSRLAAALNLHLLNPREVIEAAVGAWQSGDAPLAAVEGFMRQILGWREFVRGIYWLKMPGYKALNHFG